MPRRLAYALAALACLAVAAESAFVLSGWPGALVALVGLTLAAGLVWFGRRPW